MPLTEHITRPGPGGRSLSLLCPHLRREAPVSLRAGRQYLAGDALGGCRVRRQDAGDSSRAQVATSPVERTFGKPSILTTDGPVHKELRAGIDPKYKPKAVAVYIDTLVRPIADEYLDAVLATGGGDLMADYFEPISTLSLARSFGFHDIDMPTLRRWF